MEYTLIFNHRSYPLPKYTNTVRKRMERIDKENSDARIDDERKYSGMYQFIREMVGEDAALEIFETDNIDEMDLNHITIAYLGIAMGYEKPLNEARRSATALNDEDMKMAMKLIENSGNFSNLIKEMSKMPGTNNLQPPFMT